jgi:transcriptional regulator with XRE-family HTH domain
MPTKNAFHGAAYRRFCQKLKEARLEAGLTQRQVAKSLGKPPSFVAKIEVGERRVDFVELQALAAIYKKPISFFQL